MFLIDLHFQMVFVREFPVRTGFLIIKMGGQIIFCLKIKKRIWF